MAFLRSCIPLLITCTVYLGRILGEILSLVILIDMARRALGRIVSGHERPVDLSQSYKKETR